MGDKTGYYDRTGKAIKDGDKIKAIMWGMILIGYVEELDGQWYLTHEFQSSRLKDLDDIEILEEDE